MKTNHALLTALSAALAVGCYLALRTPVAVYSQTLPPAPGGEQFRVAFGLRDTAAKEWRGKVTVTGGEIVSMEGWRSGPQEVFSSNGEFRFTTKIGLLENQLRPSTFEYGQTGFEPPQTYNHLIPEGLIVRVTDAAATVRIETGTDSFSFQPGRIAWGGATPFLEGNASVERMGVARKPSAENTADDYPAMAIDASGKTWTAWMSYKDKADSIQVSDGSQVYTVGERGDLHAPAIAAGKDGAIRVAWPRNENGFKLYTASFRNGAWSKQELVSGEGSSNAWPAMAGDPKGNTALVWQSFRNNQSVILLRTWDGKRWSAEKRLNEGAGNAWAPAVAYGGGRLWTAWDSYDTGSYQVYAREPKGKQQRVTVGDNFSVRPSLTVTNAGRPVIAWEESDSLWGKDFAYQVDKRGTVEYKNRRIRVASFDAGEWKEIGAPVAEAMPPELRRYVQQPSLSTDAAGRLYLAFRARTSTRVARADYWASVGRWETFVTHMEGEKWTPAIPMPDSAGRNGMRCALALDRGMAHVVWATDGRLFAGNAYRDLDIYSAVLPASASAANWTGGRPMTAGPPTANPNPTEAADVRRTRDYRIVSAGKTYRILRGDFHRHTELSQDGAGDGMLDDNYRYTLDAASMDIGYVSDHQMGQGEEYNWWITQKSNDLYYMPKRFVPMYGYERSVPYPNGHRNVIWAQRGKPVLQISPEENRGEKNTGPALYPYLRETDGIATPHTSATAQGTDWRDNDQALEPVVEIYQGYDANYEEPGAPRAWKTGQTMSHERVETAGYVWNAWAKGYKLGVQSSSDHISTHTSFANVLAEDFTRQGILDAIRKRHTYASTDNIVMDFRIPNATGGEAIMGDIASATSAPRLVVRILGSAPIKQVDVIKNNKYVHQINPGSAEVRFEFVDPSVEKGESYYYVRAEQTDGQLAWSSPIWIRY